MSSTRFTKITDYLLAYTLYVIVRLLYASYRFVYVDNEHRRQAECHHSQKAIILAIWHENLFGGILAHTHQNFHPLASASRDGDFVSFVMERMGIFPIRGSSSRRGREASEEILNALNQGFSSAITVDGPKGPRRESKGGIFRIALESKAAIVPFSAVADRYWVFRKSWDQFRMPKPFSRITVRYGVPMFIESDISESDLVGYKKQLADQLNAISDR